MVLHLSAPLPKRSRCYARGAPNSTSNFANYHGGNGRRSAGSFSYYTATGHRNQVKTVNSSS